MGFKFQGFGFNLELAFYSGSEVNVLNSIILSFLAMLSISKLNTSSLNLFIGMLAFRMLKPFINAFM